MSGKVTRENFKLKAALAGVLAGGLVGAELGQLAGTYWGVSDPGERLVLASVPYILLAFSQWVIARSRADLIVLLVCAVPITLSSLLLFKKPDFLGLTHILVPIDSIMLACGALVAVLTRVLVARWLQRKKNTTPEVS